MSQQEARWIQQLKQGNDRAFAEFFKLYRTRIYQLALRFMNDPTEAEEVVQEVMLAVFRRVDSFQGQSQLSTWVYRVTVNTALMRLRSKKRENYLNFEDTIGELEDAGTGVNLPVGEWAGTLHWAEEPEQELARKELGDQILSALAELEEGKARTFLLKNLYGFSDLELSRQLQLSVSALKSQLYRSRAFLRQRLRDYLEKNPTA
ncbi:MAG: hypothetical protein A2V67_03485 [Deltaproteobacteria bacterium RBG_13_61_14]|nr:MAG: hypothetical protein A2V67_03485 [Deltaproteobacteria bacterium RBG_13_61_14]